MNNTKIRNEEEKYFKNALYLIVDAPVGFDRFYLIERELDKIRKAERNIVIYLADTRFNEKFLEFVCDWSKNNKVKCFRVPAEHGIYGFCRNLLWMHMMIAEHKKRQCLFFGSNIPEINIHKSYAETYNNRFRIIKR